MNEGNIVKAFRSILKKQTTVEQLNGVTSFGLSAEAAASGDDVQTCVFGRRPNCFSGFEP